MNDTEPQKYGKSEAAAFGDLQVVRGGQYAKRTGTPRRHEMPDPWLDREMRAVFAALHGQDRAIASRGIYDAAEGYQWPWRKIAKRLREAKSGGTSIEKVKEVVRVLDRYVDQLYSVDDDRAA